MARYDDTQPQPDNMWSNFFSEQGVDPTALGTPGGTQQSNGGSLTSLVDILKSTMYGISGRAGLSGTPLTGVVPSWVRADPQLFSAVKAGAVDPYLPTSDASTWRVFIGRSDRRNDIEPHIGQRMDDNGVPRALPGDTTEIASAVKNQPYTWSQDQISSAMKKFNDAGIPVNDLDGVVKVWSALTDQAAARYSLSSGKMKVTPWDMLAINKNAASEAGVGGGSSGGSPSTVTQTSRSVATITHGDGWNALQNTLSRMLGRDPTDEETRDFVGRMNHIAAKNPTITRSTTSGIGTGSQHTSSHTTTGFDSNDILENAYQEAQADPEYAETQAGVTYYNALLSALGAIGG